MADDVKAPSREDLAGFIRSVTYGLCDATSPTGTAAWERNKRVVDWLRALTRADNPPGEGVVVTQEMIDAAYNAYAVHEWDNGRAKRGPERDGLAVAIRAALALTAPRPAAPGDGEAEDVGEPWTEQQIADLRALGRKGDLDNAIRQVREAGYTLAPPVQARGGDEVEPDEGVVIEARRRSKVTHGTEAYWQVYIRAAQHALAPSAARAEQGTSHDA
jgi:hypothetical protein